MAVKLNLTPQQKKLKEKIIVALDTPSLDVVKKLVRELKGFVDVYKIGSELFTAQGWDALKVVIDSGARVFLDLKYHDIPNTVAKAALVACEKEIFMFNVHTLGGIDMMKAAKEAVDERVKLGTNRPIILGVTVLTSHSEKNLKDLGIERALRDQVLYLAGMAKKAGLDGVVSSPREVEMLRKEFGPDFVIVTPGIRPPGSPKDDQKRTLSPKEAFDEGASYIVVGRPVAAAHSPKEAMAKIISEL